MARLNNVRRIIVEDYPTESRETVEKLAEILNDFMTEINGVLNGNIDFDNLKRQLLYYEVTVNSSLIPIGNDKLKTGLSSVNAIIVGNVQNLTNTNSYPTTAVQVFYSNQGSGLVQINRIVGLTSGNKYRLTLEIIG